MHRRSRLVCSRRAYRLLCLLVFAVAIAVVAPTLGFAAAETGRTDPPSHTGVPNSIQSASWAKAPAWAAGLSGSSVASSQGGEVIVEFARGTQSKAMMQTAGVAGATLKWAHPGKNSKAIPFAVYKSSGLTTSQLMARLKSQPGVVAVAPNGKLQLTGTQATASQLQTALGGLQTPNDPDFAQQWALENTGQVAGTVDADIDARAAWEMTVGSGDVVVAVIDSGVDYTHPDLAGNIWANAAEELRPADGVDDDGNSYVDDVHGIDVVNGDGDPLDDNGHGTHVAGIIAAVGGNAIGTTGVAWETKIMALKAFDSTGAGTEAGVIECINYAIDMKSRGVNVVAINGSFEGGTYNQALRDAIQAAGDAGIVFVAAAGNKARSNDVTPTYPAAYDCTNVIAVGASNTYDARASYSNYGATSVDLFAPGVGILSTVPSYPSEQSLPGTELFFDDMESGSANWTATGTWAITDEANWTVGGAYSWSDSPGGDYPSSSRTTLTSRTIDLGSPVSAGSWLGFALAYELEEGYDVLGVEVSGDDGTSWESLGYFTGIGEGYYWVELPETVVTSKFKVQFVLESDEINNQDGVYLDDVCVTVPAQTAELSGTSMAAPHVTGAVALLAAVAPADAVSARINRILTTVDKPTALDGLCVTEGRLNAGRAVTNTTPPTITGISPATGSCLGGAKVAITGTGFQEVSSITFGGVPAKDWWTESPGTVMAIIPAHAAGTVRVQVTASGGSTPDGDYDDFTYVAISAVQQDDPKLYYAGSWNAGWSSSASGGSFRHASSAGAAVNITFKGTYLAWLAKKSPVYGKAWVKLDGGAPVLVDLYSSTAKYQQRVYMTGLLEDKEHTLSIYWIGQKNRAARGYNINVDAFDLVGELTQAPAPEPLPFTYQNTDPRITYLGNWGTYRSGYASGGNYHYSGGKGNAALVRFTGTSVQLLAKKGPNYGKALICLDGVWESEPVDFYSPTAAYQQTVLSRGGLDAGEHTLIIKCLGEANPSAVGCFVDLDALRITGTMIQADRPTRLQQSDTRFTYTGYWTGGWNSRASGGSFRHTNSPGSTVTVTFDGTYLVWIATKSRAYGIAKVTLDDREPVYVDLYSRTSIYKQRAYTTGLLDSATHTLTIEWTGRKNPAAKSNYVNIDAFDMLFAASAR